MRFVYFVAIVAVLSMPARAQDVSLSGRATISIVTFGPDQDEFYEAFGHSAIRVNDPALGIDYAYNYGVFSFNQPNFYLNFTKGHLYYMLGVYLYPEFRDDYIANNRFVHEQELSLTPQQKQKVFEYLEWNAQPANRTYNYDYFYDNCSSRIRDVFVLVLGDDVHFDGSYIKTDYSIRQLTDLYLDQQPWGDLGIDIGLGSKIDKKATPAQYTFLPDYLESAFDHATIHLDSVTVPIVASKKIVYAAHEVPYSPGVFHPWTVMGLVLAAAITLGYFDWRRKKLSIWFDAILFSVVGLMGSFLLFLWFGTDHHACAKNYNLLWALPTHLLAGFMLLKTSARRKLSRYFLVTCVICVLLLILWPVLPQMLNRFLIPLVAALAVRSGVLSRLLGSAA